MAQAQLLIRSNDPMYEAGMILFGSRAEDKMWQHTLQSLADYLGSSAPVETKIVCVDKKRQWKNFRNVRYNGCLPLGLGAEHETTCHGAESLPGRLIPARMKRPRVVSRTIRSSMAYWERTAPAPLKSTRARSWASTTPATWPRTMAPTWMYQIGSAPRKKLTL